jgi:phosphoribosylglycinamide formyltransferase 1
MTEGAGAFRPLNRSEKATRALAPGRLQASQRALKPLKGTGVSPYVNQPKGEGFSPRGKMPEVIPTKEPQRLGILLSGRGSNFLAIAQSIREGRLPGVEIAVVLCNVADSPGLTAAQQLGLPTAVFASKGRPRAQHDVDVIASLHAHNVDLVCLAGYMRLLSPEFIAAFPNRILNIHPSLLPAFPGLEAQKQAFDYGVKVAGCTVHFVDEHLDHGVIILQRAIPVLETDDAHSLATRILAEEHLAYAEAIAQVICGEYEIRGRRFVPRGIQNASRQGGCENSPGRSEAEPWVNPPRGADAVP